MFSEWFMEKKETKEKVKVRMDDPFEQEYKLYLELKEKNPKFVPKCRPKSNMMLPKEEVEKIIEEVLNDE